jgi:ferredoxin-NADP reductase
MAIPQTVFRPYRVMENAPLAAGMFRLVMEAVDEPLPSFQSGQWVNLRLQNPDGSEWAKAAYSIASAPSAGTQTVEFGVKLAGDFTKRLFTLKAGDQVELQGPWGVFTATQGQAAEIVCIAGGIGVTPFVSMFREAAVRERGLTLLYANRRAEEAAYLEELMALAAAHPRLRVIPTYTRESPTGWEGERGRIDAAMLRRHVAFSAAQETVYLLCGPDAFMHDVRAALMAQGVDPKKIKQESFG